MSKWTHVRGVITVDPCGRTAAEGMYVLQTVLEHLPIPRGSEGPMDWFVNVEKVSSASSSCDEYGYTTNNLITRYGTRDRSGWLEIPTQYMITIHSDFRDRYFEETFKDFIKWLTRLAKRVWVTDVLIKLSGISNKTGEDKLIILDEDRYGDTFYSMYDCNGEPRWTDHLYW